MGQIGFPATQNASSDPNTLDDYEEGTFTPALTSSGTAPAGVAYSSRFGNYTKVGNLVHFWLFIRLSSKGTGASGSVLITGLPFTIANPGTQSLEATVRIGGVTLDPGYTQFGALLNVGFAQAYLTELGSAVFGNLIPYANLANNAEIVICGAYFV